jgi:hypothetical protein
MGGLLILLLLLDACGVRSFGAHAIADGTGSQMVVAKRR